MWYNSWMQNTVEQVANMIQDAIHQFDLVQDQRQFSLVMDDLSPQEILLLSISYILWIKTITINVANITVQASGV